MAYAVGHISGGHFNSSVTVGLGAGGRFKTSDVIPYMIAQVLGAIVAAAVLYAIASGKPDWVTGGFASNGYGDLSPGKYGLVSCFLIEVIGTFFFLYVITGTTSKGAAVGFAGIPIGLCLTLINLVLIPVTNASVNPARSTGPALFAGGAYIAQLWLFWLAPILGAAIAGAVGRWQHDAPAAKCAISSGFDEFGLGSGAFRVFPGWPPGRATFGSRAFRFFPSCPPGRPTITAAPLTSPLLRLPLHGRCI